MRIRTLKPAFWAHHMHHVISETTALVAIGLLNYADDEGRFLAAPRAIECALFPIRSPRKKVPACLAELAAVGFLVTYRGTVDGHDVEVAWIPGFTDHQVINRPTPSRLPPPPITERSRSDHGMIHDQSQNMSNGTAVASFEGREGKGREGKGQASLNAREACPPAAPSPDMFEGMEGGAPPAIDGTVPKGFQDWRFRKLLGINADDSSLGGWEALYRRQGFDEMTKGYIHVMKSKKPGQKCWLNDLLKLEE